MNREPVRSSNVRSVGHDPLDQILEVEFHTGAVYRYLDVPAQRHQSLMGAASIGRYLNEHVKPNYRCVKVVG